MLGFELHRCSYERRNHPTMKWTVDTDYHPYVAINRIGLKTVARDPKTTHLNPSPLSCNSESQFFCIAALCVATPLWRMYRASQLQIQGRGEENFSLLGYYAASSGNSVPTFRNNLSVPSARIRNRFSWIFRMGQIGCSEKSIRNYHYSLRNNPKDRRSYTLGGGNLKYTQIRGSLFESRVTSSPLCSMK